MRSLEEFFHERNKANLPDLALTSQQTSHASSCTLNCAKLQIVDLRSSPSLKSRSWPDNRIA